MIQLLTHIKKIAVNKWTALLVILFIATIVTSYFVVGYSSKKLIYQNVSKLPNADVALVLGTSRYTATGYANLFFKYRIKAAVDLYKTGKVKHIIVSGDNSLFEYNEPREMRRALVREGIPIEAITLDFAGFRTLDSVVRCKEVFGQNNFIIISQEFHVARALFIAKKFNISAIGYAAQSPPQSYSFKTNFREFFARTRAVIDLYVLNTQPKFLGSNETINL
ncbi:MAG: YdcF family protein [Flavobacteriales bacterium]|nr:YdcF family protein [Flavobacteriales bacterium]